MKVSDQIYAYLLRLPPTQRRAVKAALRGLAKGAPQDTRALTDDLEGYHRLRIKQLRIVYRYLSNGGIACEFIEARATVYEQFLSLREYLGRH